MSYYALLGHTHENSLLNYQALFDEPLDSEENNNTATMKGEVYGSDSFYQKIARLAGRVTRLGRHGGNRKSDEYHDQAG